MTTTINTVAINVLSIMAVNNIKNVIHIHPKTGKNVSPLGHCETQGAVDCAFLSIRPEHRVTNAIEMIKFIGKQPANMASSKSRQLAAINRGDTLEGHDAAKAWTMAGEKITYLGNINKHADKQKSNFWKQFSSLHGSSSATWQVFQAIVGEFSKIRPDVLAAKIGLVKQAKELAGKRHCLEISEVAANIDLVERKVSKVLEIEASYEKIAKVLEIDWTELDKVNGK